MNSHFPLFLLLSTSAFTAGDAGHPFVRAYAQLLEQICAEHLHECSLISTELAQKVTEISYKPSDEEQKLACLDHRSLCEMLNEDLYARVFENDDYGRGFVALESF